MNRKHLVLPLAGILTFALFHEARASTVLPDTSLQILVGANDQGADTGIVTGQGFATLSRSNTNSSGGQATAVGIVSFQIPDPSNPSNNFIKATATASGPATAGATVGGSYSFQVSGPGDYRGEVPVRIQAQGVVSQPGGTAFITNDALLTIPGLALSASNDAFQGHLLGYACLDGPNSGGCGAAWHLANQPSFVVDRTLNIPVNTAFSLRFDLVISAHGSAGTSDDQFGMIDPIMFIDPSFDNTGLFTLDFSPDMASTPLPATLPMFMGGAGLIGLLTRRRKRKSQPG